MLSRNPRSAAQRSSDRFVPLSDPARQVLAFAREEAIRLGHDYVGTEHILLGFTREQSRAAPLLVGLGLDLDRVREGVESGARRPRARRGGDQLPFTVRTRKAMDLASVEADGMNSQTVEPGHILLGLLGEEKGIAAQVLAQLGVTLQTVREHVRKAPAAGFRVQIDDASELSIYEQIIVRIQEAVATGELRPGERLPTVRQLADQLDIAPGTVARAYSALERSGLLVTEGTRGTRVADRSGSSMPAADRLAALVGLLRPPAVAAFHLSATAQELRAALEVAMKDIFDADRGEAA